ncbi:ABC transporter permease subunit [Pseudomonas aeruginosa]|nr:ABC transporter permease subunit [Pseudomonas aeruginosa]MCS8829166.1 ABC transporter permease subunit [Pseudomonas aeruginosa]MCS8874013.1 ABC transporter permease subunit [Pseudomonas aeruginosa]MCS8907989.1 ABC transporter permease subunit [Pseudomonas aeruginosa]MCS8914040.1 ABC transporter permease subunit [Pseudomonas aeruginosa]
MSALSIINSTVQPSSFKLSMLLRDTRYRSYTIQIIALMCLMLTAAWLVDNTVRNLATLGKDFSFAFLWSPAGYDINQQPIEYTSQMSHGRAALIGFLNTAILAILSCITATIIGVLAGVLRLSNNWIVSRLMTVYIETFRNIPALLCILVIGAVMAQSMPAPSTYRGAGAVSLAVTNRGIYIPEPQFSSDWGTLNLGVFHPSMNAIALLVLVSLCFVVNRALIKHADRVQNSSGVRPKTWWKSALIFIAPPVLLLFAMGFHLGYPELRGFNFQGGLQLGNALIAMWIGLSVYTGAFIAEIVRSGILSISKGQAEAAHALGLRPGRTMRLVILPQALRVIVPPLTSQYLDITKQTSLGLAVGYMDLRSTLGGITINQTGRELECILLMMLIYLAMSLSISGLMNIYNNRVKLQVR